MTLPEFNFSLTVHVLKCLLIINEVHQKEPSIGATVIRSLIHLFPEAMVAKWMNASPSNRLHGLMSVVFGVSVVYYLWIFHVSTVFTMS